MDRCTSFRWNKNLKTCCYFEVNVVDGYLWWWILTWKLAMMLVMFVFMEGVSVYVRELLYECMHCRVICSCIHECPEAMFRGDVYDTISYQEAMFWGDDLDDEWYHMHIVSCLDALHNLTSVILVMCLVNGVLGKQLHRWFIYLMKIWWICE